MDRDQRWDRTDKALAAIVDGEGVQGSDPVQEVQRSYDAGVTDEFIEPIVFADAPRLAQGRLGDLLQLPSRPGAAVDGAPPCLTIRCDDDDALPTRSRLPCRLRRAGGARDDGRGLRASTASASCTSPRPRSTRTSPTSSTAAARTSGRARRASSSRRRETSRATTTSPRCQRPRSRTSSTRRSRTTATASRSSTWPIRTWSATPARSRPPSRPSKPPTPRSATSSTRVDREGGIALVTADHGNAEEMLDADGQPANRSHLESRTTSRDRRRRFPSGGRGTQATWCQPQSPC